MHTYSPNELPRHLHDWVVWQLAQERTSSFSSFLTMVMWVLENFIAFFAERLVDLVKLL